MTTTTMERNRVGTAIGTMSQVGTPTQTGTTQHPPPHNNHDSEGMMRIMAATTTLASPTATMSNKDGDIGEREQVQ